MNIFRRFSLTKLYVKVIFTVITELSFTSNAITQSGSSQLTQELQTLYSVTELPGFAVAIVNADSIVYLEGFGFENVADKRQFSVDQRFSVASISKTFIGISLMRLVENGVLELSTPINEILPFTVTNPYFPEEEITIEHLARHTSGILFGDLGNQVFYLRDEFKLSKKAIGKDAYDQFTAWGKNSHQDLGIFLRAVLSTEGALYSKKRFSKDKPGESYHYSNLGAALAAYIVELKTKVDYKAYIEKFALEAMGFERGVWRSTVSEIPTNYFQDQIETPNYYPILYPAGGMMLSSRELAVYLREMINGYRAGSSVLSRDSFVKMMSTNNVNQPENGIFWELKGDKIFHNGGNYGVTCFMSFDRKTGTGKVFLTNISSYKDGKLLEQMIKIWRKMDEFESQQ